MKVNSRILLNVAAIIAAGFYAVATNAHSEPSTAPHTPSHEAVQACSSKKENDVCNYTGKNHEAVTGKCQKAHGGHLACEAAAPAKTDAAGTTPAH